MYTTIIRSEQLRKHLDDPDWIIVDCRYNLADTGAGYRDYLESHIPHAVYADLDRDLSATSKTGQGRHPLPDSADLVQVFSRLGIGPGSQVVVYDAAWGSIAARFWWLLKYMHHENVAVIDGGWQAWQAQGYETQTGAVANAPRAFTGAVRDELVIDIDGIASCPLLVDSREPPRYRGDIEPIDPVAGHIPGAINRFWKDNLLDTGHFRAPHQIRYDFRQLFREIPSGQVGFYCGSGVTACHNLLAAVYSGISMSRLYAGSWSEWCGRRGAAIETGDN